MILSELMMINFLSCMQMVHPILDQSFFLDNTHKMRLKEEFKIEPWTFEQHVGEAVIIPSGCPYQIRNPKCCVHVELEFVSPENVSESIQLIDEVRLLPKDHKAKVEKLEELITYLLLLMITPFHLILFFWKARSHHEKLVIIDYKICYIGGLDLCFG
eukprot:XP_025985402.1 lysine-specific demethylase JMJ25-like [Glycine max]